MVPSSKTGVEICPQCFSSVNISVSRLIQDSCGHRKCRLCLLKEENGCLLCAARNNESGSHKKLHSPVNSNRGDTECDDQRDCKVKAHKDVRKKPSHTVKKKASSERKSEDEDDAENGKTKIKRVKFTIADHITVLPGNPITYQCTVCKKTCKTRRTVVYHNYCTSKTKPHTCEICDKGFVSKSHYDYHMKSHSGILPFVCSVCKKGFKQKGTLTRHLRLHSDDHLFVCPECGKKFNCDTSFKAHQRTHTGEKAHVCSICSRGFAELSNLRRHLLTHKDDRPYMCDECGKQFKLKSTLEAHLHVVHIRERKFTCDVCNRKFNKKRDLQRHLMVHTETISHSCSSCKLTFRRKDNYDRHMKNTHPELKAAGSKKSKIPHQNTKPASNTPVERSGTKSSVEQTNSSMTLSIPPSQTINASVLKSVPKLSQSPILPVSVSSKIVKDPQTVESSTSLSAELPESRIVSTENLPVIVQHNNVINNNSQSVSACAQTLSTSSSRDGDHIVSTFESSDKNVLSVPSQYSQEKSKTSTSVPPKKNIEYYRAVPVINRLGSANKMDSEPKTSETEDTSHLGRRVDATNCVPTITRVSYGITGSVITRNVQQRTQSVVKPAHQLECYKKLEVPPHLLREPPSRPPAPPSPPPSHALPSPPPPPHTLPFLPPRPPHTHPSLPPPPPHTLPSLPLPHTPTSLLPTPCHALPSPPPPHHALPSLLPTPPHALPSHPPPPHALPSLLSSSPPHLGLPSSSPLPPSPPLPSLDQPSLRRLLNDVDCSDRNPHILNLTNDPYLPRLDTLSSSDTREFDKYNRSNICGAQFFPPKLSEVYNLPACSQTKETSSSASYITQDCNRNFTPEGVLLESNLRSTLSQTLNYDFSKPYRSEERMTTETAHWRSELPSVSSCTMYKYSSNQYTYETYNTKHIDNGGRLRMLADIAGSEESSTYISSIEQPVIVGAKKNISNLICDQDNCNPNEENC